VKWLGLGLQVNMRGWNVEVLIQLASLLCLCSHGQHPVGVRGYLNIAHNNVSETVTRYVTEAD